MALNVKWSPGNRLLFSIYLGWITVKFAGVAAVAIPTSSTFGLVALTLAGAVRVRPPAPKLKRVA